ncbi:MAG: hypothetical protein OXU75_06425, partial [Deltaproteobacteria bacterium]|nr:hypothetical protein [Deltaproteobacteria bacterium]
DGPSPASVEHHVKRWISAWQCAPAFLVVESGNVGGRFHAHGLLTAGLQNRRALWADWHRRYGRCRFEPIPDDDRRTVDHYVAKYCAKETLDGTVLPMRWWVTPDGRWE